MDEKEQGIGNPQAPASTSTARKRKSKREIRQQAKGIQAGLAIVVGILIAIFAAMSPSPAVFTLNKALFNYARVRSVWFGDLAATNTAAPTQDHMRKWYGRGASPDERAAFDETCSTSFRAALDSVGPEAFPLPDLRSGGNSSYAAELAHAPTMAAPFARELAEAGAANGTTTTDIRAGEEAVADTALAMLLLLDQMPRNIFRAVAEQKLVYGHYDRIARSVLRHVLAMSPRADLHPKFRMNPVFRLWFYMPLMHSEFMEDHRRYEELVGEMVGELERGGDAEALEHAKMSVQFGRKHAEIIERFGRYPHRNEVMGRTMTKEEKEYLEAGGETFGTGTK